MGTWGAEYILIDCGVATRWHSQIWQSNRCYGNMGSRVRWALFISTLNDDTVCMNIVDLSGDSCFGLHEKTLSSLHDTVLKGSTRRGISKPQNYLHWSMYVSYENSWMSTAWSTHILTRHTCTHAFMLTHTHTNTYKHNDVYFIS